MEGKGRGEKEGPGIGPPIVACRKNGPSCKNAKWGAQIQSIRYQVETCFKK